jgi:hypothetical protein
MNLTRKTTVDSALQRFHFVYHHVIVFLFSVSVVAFIFDNLCCWHTVGRSLPATLEAEASNWSRVLFVLNPLRPSAESCSD